MSKRAATADKRKTESPEAGETPRKKRRRGRRQARRFSCLLRRQSAACVGLTADPTKLNSNETETLVDNFLCSPEGKRTEKNTNCHFLCRTKHPLCHETNHSEGTFSCNTADKLNNYCRCDDRKGGDYNADDYSQCSSDASGGEGKRKCLSEKPLSDCDTCNTPSDHNECDKTSNRDGKHDATRDNPYDKDNLGCSEMKKDEGSPADVDSPHHLSLLPPPSHLPLHSYPPLLPSFSPHLSPLTLNPPPAPPPPPPPPPPPIHPSFYSSSPIPLLDAPGPYPLATAFHPMQSHPPPLYPPPHPAVLPLQQRRLNDQLHYHDSSDGPANGDPTRPDPEPPLAGPSLLSW
ncbi:hypothetical protein ABVT39_021584 [Epinephelus coioides]